MNELANISQEQQKLKFVYRSSPIFRESDKEAIEAWESRAFDTMLIFCKLYLNEEGKRGLGYVIVYEDGWQYGSFQAHLGNLEIKEASLKGLFEVLSYASELKARKIIIWSENKVFLEQLCDESIKRKKNLAELVASFEQVSISDLSGIDIENIDKLRDSALSSAKLGSKSKSKHKFKVLMTVSEKKESKQEIKWREEQITSILAESLCRHARRPTDVKISDSENELKELERNKNEAVDYEAKKEEFLKKLESLQEIKKKEDARKVALAEAKPEIAPPKPDVKDQVNQTLVNHGICFSCGKSIENTWKFCPFCAVNLVNVSQ